MSIAVLPTQPSVEAAWERYRVLAVAVADDYALAANRAHMEEMARAELAYKRAYQAWAGS